MEAIHTSINKASDRRPQFTCAIKDEKVMERDGISPETPGRRDPRQNATLIRRSGNQLRFAFENGSTGSWSASGGRLR